jgi:hypothetical protein
MVARVLIGKDQGDRMVVNFSRPGHDALLADPIDNPEKFAFSSRWAKLNRVQEAGRVAHNFGSNGSTAMPEILIARNPNFDPMFRVMSEHPTADQVYEDRWRRLSVAGSTGDRVSSFTACFGNITTTTAGIKIHNTRGREYALTGAQRFRYTVFDLPANDIEILPPPPPPDPEDLPIPLINKRWAGWEEFGSGTTFQFPTNIQAGDVLIYCARTGHGSTRNFTLPGYTIVADLFANTGSTSRPRVKLGYRLADGSENGMNDLLRGDEIEVVNQCLYHFRPPVPATSLTLLTSWGVQNVDTDAGNSRLVTVAGAQNFPAQTGQGIIRFLNSHDNHGDVLAIDPVTGGPAKLQAVSPTMPYIEAQALHPDGYTLVRSMVELSTFLGSAPAQSVVYTGTNVNQASPRPSGHCYMQPVGLSLRVNW